MDTLRLTLLLVAINKALFFFCLLLGCSILLSIFLQEKILIRRVLQLIRVRRDLRAVASKGDAEIRRVCPLIMEKTSPEDFLELTRSKSTFMPPEFADDLRKCFSASGKMEGLEKKAKLHFLPKWQKIQILVTLGYAEDAQAFLILKKALGEKDADVSYYAMLSLAQLKTNAAARALLDHCAQKPGDGRKIASCLETFPPEALDELIRATYAKSDAVRFWAVRVMTKFKDK
jgi:HEAT repeat protein